jgi:hypothetical protein
MLHQKLRVGYGRHGKIPLLACCPIKTNIMTPTEGEWFAGLFAIGEAVDVTGWLGGYNFQWAWASAHAAAGAL